MRDLRDKVKDSPRPGGRDLRDPLKLGEALNAHKEDLIQEARKSSMHGYGFYAVRMSSVYEDAMRRNLTVPDVSKDDSLGKQCVRDYRAELERRTEEGDKYAQSALESINAGEGVKGFDLAG